jgi:hypothetical protein
VFVIFFNILWNFLSFFRYLLVHFHRACLNNPFSWAYHASVMELSFFISWKGSHVNSSVSHLKRTCNSPGLHLFLSIDVQWFHWMSINLLLLHRVY